MNAAQLLKQYFDGSVDAKPVWAVFDADGQMVNWSTWKNYAQNLVGRYQAEQAADMWVAKVSK